MKLLICDDEILTLDVIESQLDCTALGISQVLRAYNGQAAKEMIDQYRPELILCDIGMPISNGIDVLKYVHEQGIQTEFAFLTCYQDFEYAQAALKYGAFSYITKPFLMDELVAVLKSMIEASTEKRLSGLGQRQVRHDSVMNSVLRQLSYGLRGSDRHSAEVLLRQNGLSISPDSQWNVVLTCSDMTDALADGWSSELLLYTLSRLHDEVLAGYVGAAYTLIYSDERFIWCRCFVPAEACSREDLFTRSRQLSQLCSEQVSLRPAVLISDRFSLYEAFEVCKLLTAKMQNLRFSKGVICDIHQADSLCQQQGDRLDRGYLLQLLNAHNSEAFRQYISSVLQSLPRGADIRPALDNLRCEMLHLFSACLRDNGLAPEPVLGEARLSALNALSARSEEDMLSFSSALYAAVEEKLRQLQDSADIIARVENYIRAHFRENINRDDVAAIVYITPNYLSKLFRSKMGMNLREYINQIRIEEARRMLLTTNLSVSEIAGHVGYDNISYFSTVFRKLVGTSPVDWRNAKRTNGGNHETER